MGVEAHLALKFEGLQQSVDGIDKRVEDFITAQQDRYRGVKWMRLPLTLSGAVASSAISLGEATGQVLGPRPGYAWSIKRVVVSGLTSGATPDVVNLYRSSSGQQPLWQFNGNNFGYTFGKGELTLISGDTLALANVGTITAAAGTIITVSGELIEVPAEMLAKLLT